MSEPTIAEVIARVRQDDPNRVVAVECEVWASPYESNSGFSIYDGKSSHKGKTLADALANFIAGNVTGDAAEDFHAQALAIAADDAASLKLAEASN